MNESILIYGMLGVYALLTLVISLFSFRASTRTLDDYFLASRRIGTLVLFFTLIATNFSAFFFLGFAGAGYRIGYSYYGVIAFGTSLVALAFYLIGYKVWKLGKRYGYLTPPELIGRTHGSNALALVYLIVMVIFTVPYLALQPIGAGYILSSLTGGEIPYFVGAFILTAFIVFYVYLGGMRTVAWTDVLQGILMFTLISTALVYIAHGLGGLGAANLQALERLPELFSKAGIDDYYTPQKWFSFTVLWFFSVPMFPHIFMRFFLPRTAVSLKITVVLYPVVTALLFLLPITIGVLGHIPFPDLQGKEVDSILPMMLATYTPYWFEAMVMIGAIAAFMSTMDSQLLALSSIITKDLFPRAMKRTVRLNSQVIIGRVMVAVFALLGLAIAYRPPATILEIATQTFTGLAVLFPTTVATLYWQRTSAASCIVSILAGETLLVGFHSGLLPESVTLGFLPLVPILIICTLIIVLGSLMSKKGRTMV